MKKTLDIGKPFPTNFIDLLDYLQPQAELVVFVESSYCLYLMLLSRKCTFIHRMCIRSGVRRAPVVYLHSFLISICGKHRLLLDTVKGMTNIIVKHLSITSSLNCQEEFLEIYEESQ